MPLYRRPGSKVLWCRGSVAGVPYRRSTQTTDEGAAEEFEHRERDRLWRLHKLGDKSAVTWRVVAERWLKTTTKRSMDMDIMILESLDPLIGDEPISYLDRDALDQIRSHWLNDGAKERSPATVDRYMCLVRSILNACVKEWGYLDKAPAVPMYNAEKREPRWLTKEEWRRLDSELREIPHLRYAVHFAVLTGLRMRAQLSLTWTRVDLENRRIWIPSRQQKAARTHGMPITREAVGILKKLKALNPQGEHVFQWKGQPIDDVNGLSFQEALKRAGIHGANWHTLRHTFASWAVQGGVTLQELMGLGDWSDIRSVLVYAHLAPDHLAAAAAKISTKQAQTKRAKVRKA